MLHFAVQPRAFFLGKLFHPAVFSHGLQQFQPLDGLLQCRPVGQRAAQPAVVHKERSALFRLFRDGFLSLTFGANE